MCLATVYVEENGERERVMEDVAWVVFDDDAIQLVSLLGERKQLKSRIKTIDLVKGLITVEAEQ